MGTSVNYPPPLNVLFKFFPNFHFHLKSIFLRKTICIFVMYSYYRQLSADIEMKSCKIKPYFASPKLPKIMAYKLVLISWFIRHCPILLSLIFNWRKMSFRIPFNNSCLNWFGIVWFISENCFWCFPLMYLSITEPLGQSGLTKLVLIL